MRRRNQAELYDLPVEEGGTSLEMIPSSIAQQIFSITSSAAGGLVGFVLAYKMRNVKRMSTAETLIASGIVIAATLGSVMFVRTFR